MTCKDCLHEKVCDALIKSGCPYLDEEIPADAFCMVFKNKADVVPKSEVHESVEKLMSATDKVICEAKREVALAFMDWLQANDHINKSEACRREICELFLADELKKKYTNN